MISLLVWLFADLLAAAQEIRRKLSRATSRVLTDLRGDPANQIIIAVVLGCHRTSVDRPPSGAPAPTMMET
jgi:hypothetical protein